MSDELSPFLLRAVCDRLHAIHQAELPTVNAQRYYKPDKNGRFSLPMIFPVPGRSTLNPNAAGTFRADSTRLVRGVLICGAWTDGVPSESAQVVAEALIDVIGELYDRTKRLELDGDRADMVVSSSFQGDSGILNMGANAGVEFYLSIRVHMTRRTVVFAGGNS